jgi:hypothetical protein
MRQQVNFTHLITGKTVTIFDRSAIAGIMTGDCVDAAGKTHLGAAWIIVDKVSNPIPVRETSEEINKLLGIIQEKDV